MITILSTNWAQAWGMAGISVSVVFSILVLLVLVLYIFTFVAEGMGAKGADASKPKSVTGAEFAKAQETDQAAAYVSASEADKVAIATAVHLYLANQHDEESGVLTICHLDHPAWHAELNDHL